MRVRVLFLESICNETIEDAESCSSYIKIINVEKQHIFNDIEGYAQGKIVIFLLNTHITSRTDLAQSACRIRVRHEWSIRWRSVSDALRSNLRPMSCRVHGNGVYGTRESISSGVDKAIAAGKRNC